MEKFLLGLFALVMSQLAMGQPATFQDDVLTIPQGAVIDSDNPAFFTNIQLSQGDDGQFKLAVAQANNLATIDTVQIVILESFPVQVSINVTGNKSVPCVELLTPAISRKDNLFIVVLAETSLGPEESCIAMIDPFETSFALDVSGLPAGTYTVRINGEVDETFTLDADIPPS
jgi:hypothetical protein